MTVSARLRPGFIANDVMPELSAWIEKESAQWKPGYGYTTAGEAEQSGKANKSINDQLPIAFFIIVMLLVGQFNSIRRPLIILITLPLGLIGVVYGLLIAESSFGFMTFLGVISLFGIVINNAIVLIDRIEIERAENGLSPQHAVVMAAQRRFRPIILTTATTIAGLIPLWLAGSPMFQPMAVAIIFGLAFATVLTLGAVPALYSLSSACVQRLPVLALARLRYELRLSRATGTHRREAIRNGAQQAARPAPLWHCVRVGQTIDHALGAANGVNAPHARSRTPGLVGGNDECCSQRAPPTLARSRIGFPDGNLRHARCGAGCVDRRPHGTHPSFESPHPKLLAVRAIGY